MVHEALIVSSDGWSRLFAVLSSRRMSHPNEEGRFILRTASRKLNSILDVHPQLSFSILTLHSFQKTTSAMGRYLLEEEDAFELVSRGPSTPQGHSALSANPEHLAPTREDDATGIIADVLIPGKGKPLKDQAVVAKHGKIVFVGSRKDVATKYASIKWHEVPVLMPGMWECHAHFMGADPNKPINSENMALTNPTVAGARNVRALKDTLYAGFTSCVDLGGYAPELQKVIDEKIILGPTLYGTGAALSQTAGHGDVFE